MRGRSLVFLALVAGCDGEAVTTGGLDFDAFVGNAGRLYELRVPVAPSDTAPADTAPADTAPADTGASAPPSRWLRVADDSWTLTEGPTADGGTAVAVWVTRRESGLFVDEIRLLPAKILAGETADGATVVAVADWDTRYGTFPDAVEVEIAAEGGAWVGTQVFAKGVGPVFLTIDGAAWETVWYE